MPLSLRWENPLSRRYYIAYLHQDLFQNWLITKAWGSMIHHQGRVTHVWCKDYSHGLEIINKLKKQRKQHRYNLCYEKSS